MNAAPIPAELEGEQEVDLSSAWSRIKERWWLPVAGLLVGAVLGVALALSSDPVFRAQTIVYLGQPFAPLGGGQIQSLATNPVNVSEIVRSESVMQAVSAETGIPVGKLRSSISTKQLTAEGQLRGINPLMEIAVKGSSKEKVVDAADEFASRVVERVSDYVAQKTKLLEQEVAAVTAQLASVNERIESAQAQQDAVLADRTLPLDQRLLLTSNLNQVISTADARRASLQNNLAGSRQLLNLAENVESATVVEKAAARKTTARSSRSSLIVGALVGLMLGVLAALVAGTLAAKRGASAATT